MSSASSTTLFRPFPLPLTNKQWFYILFLQGIGAGFIDAGANFGIAYASEWAPCLSVCLSEPVQSRTKDRARKERERGSKVEWTRLLLISSWLERRDLRLAGEWLCQTTLAAVSVQP
jgi:hypothetical protein